MEQNKGITLIALVISIIVMLILAGVSINATIGENGIITQSQKAAFLAEMTQLQESVDMKRVSRIANEMEESMTYPLFEQSIGSDLSKMPLTLIAEIMYTRNGMDAGTGRDADEILSDKKERARVENFRLYGGNSQSIYYIDADTGNGKEKAYVYDAQTRICYKIDGARYGGHIFHSLIWSDIVINNDTTFVENGLVMVAGINVINGACAYEPDMSGFTAGTSTSPKTYMVYYSNDGTTQLKPLSDYINGRPREYNGGVLYDYTNKFWANVKCVGKNEKGIEMETWWTWIPRYAYKLNGNKTVVQFIDTSDKIVNSDGTTSDLSDDYTVHSAFNQNGKALKGIWVSKYPPSKNESSEKTIAPDFTQFADSETTVLAFDVSGRYYVEIPLSTYNTLFEDVESTNYDVREVKLQSIVEGHTTESILYNNSYNTLAKFAQHENIVPNSLGTNLTSVSSVVSANDSNAGEIFYIYNYSKKIWANSKTVASSGATRYWVWIPRYAYSLENSNTDIIFVDTNDMPVDGDEVYGLPSMYTVHSAFNQNNTPLRGIWVAKYPVSQKEAQTNVNYANANVPDLNDQTAVGSKQSISAALNNAEQVVITYYSPNGRQTSTTTYSGTTGTYALSKLGTTDSHNLDNISSTKSVTSSYGSNITYSMYRYDLGLPFTISIKDKTTKQSTPYTWWPRYADKGYVREFIEGTGDNTTGYTFGSDFAKNDGKTGVWK